MSELVVFLAPSGPCGAIREVLTDWSAAGLVSPFVWIEPRMLGVAQIAGLSVVEGAAEGVSLQERLTTQRYDRIRLVALVPVLPDATTLSVAEEQTVAELLDSSAGGTVVSRIRAVLVRGGGASRSADLGHDGWHNVMISPELSPAPGRGHSLLTADATATEFAAHSSTVLAGLAGLWAGLAGAPLDDEVVLPGAPVRLVRSFYRRLETDRLGAELRARVTDTSEVLPLPVENGPASVHIEDDALATTTMAKALWARHQDVLRGPREERPVVEPKPVGLVAVLRLFFGFLWAALKNAPQKWYRTTVARVSSRAAGAVHNALFGSEPAAYAVVVNGMSASGVPASWLEVGEAADSLDRALEESGEAREHHVRSDLSSLWTDYAAAALTLADAGERVPALPPVVIGTQRGILRTPSLVVPSAKDRFEGLPGHLAAQIEVGAVDAFDVLAIHDLTQRLGAAQNADRAGGLEASRSLDEVNDWNGRHRGSFASRVGQQLGGAVVHTTGEIKSLLEALRTAGGPDDASGASGAGQKRLALFLRILTIVAVVLLIVDVVLYRKDVLSGKYAGIVAAVLVVAWLVTALISFYRTQRDLFRVIHAREEAAAQVETTKRNLRQAVRDLRRLTDAYGQFLAWSTALGTLLAEPLGRRVAETDSQPRLSAVLPVPMVIGEALVDDAALGDAALTLRREVFRVGWLTDPWEALVGSAADTIGPTAQALRTDPQAIYREPAGADTLLETWVSRLGETGVDSAVADELWEVIRTRLESTAAEVVPGLQANIVPRGKSIVFRQGQADFLAGVDRPDEVPLGGIFDLSTLTAQAQASRSPRVDLTWGQTSHRGLSVVASLTQLSVGGFAYDYVAYPATAPTVPPIPETPALPADDGFVF